MKLEKFFGLPVLYVSLLLAMRFFTYGFSDQKSTVETTLSSAKENIPTFSKDTISSAKELKMLSNTGEDITSKITTILLDDRKIPLDSANLIDPRKIKNIAMKYQEDGIWLYIYTK